MFSTFVQRLSIIALVGLVITSFAGAATAGDLDKFANMQGTLDLAGGTAHVPVMKEAAQNIMAFNPKIRITIAGGGSGVGVQKVGEGMVSIGNTGRPLTEKEIEKYGLKSFPFAIDGVAVIVNPKNPISDLKSEQVRNIFSGQIKNWKDLGGKEQEIHLFTRDEASGTREVFWEILLKKGPIVNTANVVPSNGAMKIAVSQDENAIGYMSIGHVDRTVKAISLDGAAPTQDNAINGTYAVVRKLYMNTKGAPSPLAQAFIDYILSPTGAGVIEKYGYIPSR